MKLGGSPCSQPYNRVDHDPNRAVSVPAEASVSCSERVTSICAMIVSAPMLATCFLR